MSPRSMPSPVVLPFLLLAGLRGQESAPAPRVPPAPAPLEADEALDADGRPTHVVVRVVDGETLAPIGGAVLSLVEEGKHPLPGPWTAVRTAVAGANGRICVRVDDLRSRYDWHLVEAPGYGPHMEMHLPRTVHLFRGFDVTVEVRNPLGRAAARAGVGLIMGCGHTPDIRFVTTDDAGRATLPCVPRDGNGIRDLWVVTPGLLSDYEDLAEWRPGAAPQVVRCAPAPVIEGTILDHEGRPAAGVFVGAPNCHRGPWTRTAADGTFALAGAPLDHGLTVHLPGAQEAAMWATAPPSGTRVVLRLPRPGTEWDPGPLVPVRVRVADEQGEPAPGVSVLAARAADGFAERGSSDEVGELKLELPSGDYELVADGRLGVYGRKTQALRVTDGMREEVVVRIPRNPRIRVTLEGDGGAEGSILLATLSQQRDVTKEVLAGEPVCVPQSEDAVFWIARSGAGRAIDIPRDARSEDARPLVLVWPRPAVARVRLADGQGRPVRGWAALLPGPFADVEALAALRLKPAGAELEVPATWAGSGFLFALPEDAALAPLVRAPVTIPGRADVTLDAGAVVFEGAEPEPRSLRVLGAKGEPVPATVRVFREGAAARVDLRADGTVHPLFAAQLREGDRVVVEPDAAGPAGYLPLSTALAGPPPWTIRIPGGTLRITAKDAAGARIEDFRVVLDDAEVWNDDGGEVVLLGVPAGAHRLVVAAAGRPPRAVDLTLGDGESRDVAVTLAQSPPGK